MIRPRRSPRLAWLVTASAASSLHSYAQVAAFTTTTTAPPILHPPPSTTMTAPKNLLTSSKDHCVFSDARSRKNLTCRFMSSDSSSNDSPPSARQDDESSKDIFNQDEMDEETLEELRAEMARIRQREYAEENQQIEAEVRKWVEEIIIGLNLCPFAEKSARGTYQHTNSRGETHTLQRMEVSVVRNNDPEELLRWVLVEMLIRRQFPGTTLVVCPECHPTDFDAFLDMVSILDEEIVPESDLEGIIQIAPFHPLFQFEGSELDDVDNWTNRSPYPIFHILREDEVSRATQALDGDAGRVWKRNVHLLHAIRDQMGQNALERLYQYQLAEPDEPQQLRALLQRFKVEMAKRRGS